MTEANESDKPLGLASTDGLGPLPAWEDPSVQAAYEVLCDLAEPPDGEHWEGFVARRIVAALRAVERKHVRIPASAAEAKAMATVAIAWLREHAPDDLRPEFRA